ncbi:MAG: SurA N-terminal domain-containing protein [Verrucomicrobiota bacterium]
MKSISFSVFLVFLIVGFVPQSARAQKPVPSRRGPVEVNAVAALVNGKVITKNQVGFMLAPVRARLMAKYPRGGPKFEAEFKKALDEVIQELIDRQVILWEFKELKANVPAYAIDEEIKRQQREHFNGSEAKFREELKQSRMTMEGYREMTRDKLIVQSMRAKQFSDAPPPLPDEVRAEYAKVRHELRDKTKDRANFRKIFIPSMDPANPLATPETQLTLSEKLAEDLAAGKEDFAEAAKKHSKDAFAANGGLQEDIGRQDLSAEFAAILFEAKKGEVVGPLLDPAGFTIMKPVSFDYGPAPSLTEVRDMIEERVRRKKTSAQFERWIKARRERAVIKRKM